MLPLPSERDVVTPVHTPVVLTPIPIKERKRYPVLGSEVQPILHGSTCLVGPSGSGKTTLLLNFLQRTLGPLTRVFLLGSTMSNDPAWRAIQEWLTEHGITNVAYTSIFEERPTGKEGKTKKVNLLTEFMKLMEAQAAEEKEKRRQEDSGEWVRKPGDPIGGGWDRPPPKKEREFLPTIDPFLVNIKGKGTFEYPGIIFVLDDLSNELRNPAVSHLLRKCRHYRCAIYLSSQHWCDVDSAARQNLRQWHLFGRLSPEKLKSLYEAIQPADCSFEKFERRYRHATQEPHSFLTINTQSGKMLQNFNKEYVPAK